MKLVTALAFILFSFMAAANKAEMQTLIQLTRGNMYGGHVPTGYSTILVTNLRVKGALKNFMERTTRKKVADWKDYVLTSGEFGGTREELEAIAADPLGNLQVEALLEISEVYAIYKGNRLIGYYIEISDHVQAAIYQDGAWYEVFTDEKFSLVQVSEESA